MVPEHGALKTVGEFRGELSGELEDGDEDLELLDSLSVLDSLSQLEIVEIKDIAKSKKQWI